jgi:hypothetical protein
MHSLEGWVIKITLGAAFVGVFIIFAGKISILVFSYLTHSGGFHEIAAWAGKVIVSAMKNAGVGLKDALWSIIFE